MKTTQTDFWESDFGKEYTERNSHLEMDKWNNYYIERYGKTKLALNDDFLGHLDKNAKILEVGSNTGMQLRGFQHNNFQHLFGVEIQAYAVKRSRDFVPDANVVQGSALDIPFKDGFFDVVGTHYVLIHISPDDLGRVMDEMYRCSNRYILGLEYHADAITEIGYRGNTNVLWKANYAEMFMQRFPDLKMVKSEILPYLTDDEKGNVDCMYLLEKTS